MTARRKSHYQGLGWATLIAVLLSFFLGRIYFSPISSTDTHEDTIKKNVSVGDSVVSLTFAIHDLGQKHDLVRAFEKESLHITEYFLLSNGRSLTKDLLVEDRIHVGWKKKTPVYARPYYNIKFLVDNNGIVQAEILNTAYQDERYLTRPIFWKFLVLVTACFLFFALWRFAFLSCRRFFCSKFPAFDVLPYSGPSDDSDYESSD